MGIAERGSMFRAASARNEEQNTTLASLADAHCASHEYWC